MGKRRELGLGVGNRTSRRAFLRGGAAASAVLGVSATTPFVSRAGAAAAAQTAGPAATPTQDGEIGPLPEQPSLTMRRSGADFMVDVIKTLDIDYVAANPGSSFRGLQESLINYGGNRKPEFLTCCHEESSVAMAHGYFKISGKPMAALLHGTVGVQHASMAIYNAFADRVPVLMISGNSLDANTRRPDVEWEHSVQDNASMVRDYTKWDDTPLSLQHFAESQVRGLKIATAPPGGPVLLTIDVDLQERELTAQREALLSIPKLSPDVPARGDAGAVEEAAALLLRAERPVIVADRFCRTPAGIPLLVQLAELLQAPVIDTGDRFNFPSQHVLNHSEDRAALLAQADVILALEVVDLWALRHVMLDLPERPWRRVGAPGSRLVAIGLQGTVLRSNFQDFQRYAETDLSITGDAEATLPDLIEAVASRMSPGQRKAIGQRARALADRRQLLLRRREREVERGWHLSPVHPVRLLMELWEQIKDDDWSLVGFPNVWARRLWTMEKFYSHTGGTGAAGIGYGAPAAVGAALANREHGRLSVAIQPDGDLMYAPGILWTAAHHRIPLLFVMYNNRAYHQEIMHIQRIACRHERGLDTYHIGTTLRDPDIRYAQLAQSMGVYGEGPITDPADLRAALMRALAVVRRGEPALLDVVCQPR